MIVSDGQVPADQRIECGPGKIHFHTATASIPANKETGVGKMCHLLREDLDRAEKDCVGRSEM